MNQQPPFQVTIDHRIFISVSCKGKLNTDTKIEPTLYSTVFCCVQNTASGHHSNAWHSWTTFQTSQEPKYPAAETTETNNIIISPSYHAGMQIMYTCKLSIGHAICIYLKCYTNVKWGMGFECEILQCAAARVTRHSKSHS